MIDVLMYVQIRGSVNKVCTGVWCARSIIQCLKRICSFKICMYIWVSNFVISHWRMTELIGVYN